MGDATDDDLFRELMTPDDDEDRNRVRQKMFQCFDEIAVHGFPRLNLLLLMHMVLTIHIWMTNSEMGFKQLSTQ